MKELILGIGFNDKTKETRFLGKDTKEYAIWYSMLVRCTQKYWDKRPTYIGTTCSENFKSYAFFYEWCQSQVGFSNIDENGRSWNLDKDVLVKGNKVYSEDTCVFVPSRINSLLIKSNSTRGDYPLGVSLDKKNSKFVARCHNDTKHSKYIGHFKTVEEAFKAYKVFKESYVIQVAEDYKYQLDLRVYSSLLNYKVEITD